MTRAGYSSDYAHYPYSPQALRALVASCVPLYSGWAAADRQIGTGRRRVALGAPAGEHCMPLGETPSSPHPPAVGTLLLPRARSNACPPVRTSESPWWGVETAMHAGCRSASTD